VKASLFFLETSRIREEDAMFILYYFLDKSEKMVSNSFETDTFGVMFDFQDFCNRGLEWCVSFFLLLYII